MKAGTRILFYVLSVAALLSLAWLVLHKGHQLENNAVPAPAFSGGHTSLMNAFTAAIATPLSTFILQLTVIIIASRICGYLIGKIGQPAVMGEILAGIILGPSLIGSLCPSFTAFIFPKESLGNLQMLSQVGLILFMFVVGMELDMELLKKKAGAALMISHASIVVPFGLGLILAYFIYQTYAPPHIPFHHFALFLGIAMSITAFPVLARIIRERGLTQTRLGGLAITCAAAGDVTAWCMLAFIMAIVRADSPGGSFFTVLFMLLYAAIMLFAVKPLLRRVASKQQGNLRMRQSTVAFVFITLLLSAYACELIGIHALFGAFFAGVIMPVEWNFRKELIDKIEDVALVLLLPLFFIYTGLRTEIGLLNNASLWSTCALIIVVAVAGKFGGSALAARFTGETLKDSLSIGALMNTRGLMELVVLNIGYDLGILTPEVFTMMVMMAIITTLMTGPALSLINRMKTLA